MHGRAVNGRPSQSGLPGPPSGWLAGCLQRRAGGSLWARGQARPASQRSRPPPTLRPRGDICFATVRAARPPGERETKPTSPERFLGKGGLRAELVARRQALRAAQTATRRGELCSLAFELCACVPPPGWLAGWPAGPLQQARALGLGARTALCARRGEPSARMQIAPAGWRLAHQPASPGPAQEPRGKKFARRLADARLMIHFNSPHLSPLELLPFCARAPPAGGPARETRAPASGAPAAAAAARPAAPT